MTSDSAAGNGRFPERISARQFAVGLALLVVLAAILRTLFPLADPPWRSTVGVVWHDEGAWTHNARNLALSGQWSLDRWNPMYITPVLTGLEYASFRAFGVGLWQARLVSEAMGVMAVLLLGLGVARIGGRLAGLAAAGLLATNFVAVMYDRAALMEATMVALVVASWYCYSRADESPRWGFAAGLAAVLAYFTKASAVFFIPALALDALVSILWPHLGRDDGVRGDPAELPPAGGQADRRLARRETGRSEARARGAWFTIAGLVAAGVVSLIVFVGPNWQDYRFYNWQVSVTRKPSYTLKALLDRASWFPVIHDFFTRMWAVTVLAAGCAMGLFFRWRRVAPAERLLALWVLLGMTELVLHDVGNERRLVLLIPGLVALAALAIGRERRLLDEAAERLGRRRALLAAPIVCAGLYFVCGAVVRLPFLDEIHAGVFRSAVRWSSGAAAALGVLVYATWPIVPRLLSRVRWSAVGAAAVLGLLLTADLWQFSEWAAIRTYKNYSAMVAIGQWLPPGTLVHGKLANGLALESRIKPVFIGRGFGNYDDRADRPDVRYLLTYVSPSVGYESQARNPVVLDVLDACPGWKVVREFDVAESPGGRDRAALIDKYPGLTR